MSTDYMLNPDKYHISPLRLDGEKDEQYKLRLRAYSMGQQSRQAEADALQKRIDKTDRLIMSFGDSIDVPLRNSLIDAIRGLEDL